ncbi:MAG TPA: SirB2 family protein [Ktedonobacterales bacterium]|nr:SirB2 family protein [Ktedonobacterales bacterium]
MFWLFTVVKFLHILLAIVAIGFNATYAIWIQRAERQPEHLDFALRGVKILDDYVANPAYLLLLVTGLSMVFLAKYNLLETFWLLAALILYLIAIGLGYGAYTPTLRRQIQTLAAEGVQSQAYQSLSLRGTIIGSTLGVLVLLILGLMVLRPTF